MNFVTTGIAAVSHTLPAGVVTTHETTDTSLYVTYNGVTTRYSVDTATNSDADTAGVLTVSSVNFADDGLYVLKFVSESLADLDTDEVTLTTVSTGTVRKITTTTITI